MDSYKPEYYMECFWEHREGYQYKQPVDRINGKRKSEWPIDSYEYENWANIFWENLYYHSIIKTCRYNDDIWDVDKRDEAFKIIWRDVKADKSASPPTPIQNMEIWLMNDGYEMVKFDMMNALKPGLNLHIDCESRPLGISISRFYVKGNSKVYFGFGTTINERKVNFYFNKNGKDIQVEHTREFYDKHFKISH